MFLGEYLHTLDGKFRLMLPAKYQAQLEAGLVITKGLGKSLWIFDRATFEKRSQKIIGLPIMDAENQKIRQHWFGSAQDAALDSQGRMVLPEKLRTFIGVGASDEVALVGNFDFIALFTRDDWNAQSEKLNQLATEDNGAMWSKYGI